MKESAIKYFDFDDDAVRVLSDHTFGAVRAVDINDEPWFVAKDVCNILGHRNPTVAMKQLDDDDHTLISVRSVHYGTPVNAVSMRGAQKLAAGSRNACAKPFRRWLECGCSPVDECLNQSANTTNLECSAEQAESVSQVYSLLANEQMENGKLRAKVAKLQGQIAELQSQISELTAVSSFDPSSLSYSVGEVTNKNESTTIVARQFGVSARALNDFLYELDIIERDKFNNKYWTLRDEYSDAGIVEFSTFCQNGALLAKTMHWTPKGQQFIHELVAERGKKVGNKILVK